MFVTKDGKIVYALPSNSSAFGCRGELHSPNVMRSSKKFRKTNITYNLIGAIHELPLDISYGQKFFGQIQRGV